METKLPTDLLNRITNYLLTCPSQQVFHLLIELRELGVIKTQKDLDKEKSNAEVVKKPEENTVPSV